MVTLSRFRTVWGIDPGDDFVEWTRRFSEWKGLGYDGIEVDTYCFFLSESQLQRLQILCSEAGLKISALIFTGWGATIGPRPRGLTPDVQLGIYRESLRIASILKPVRVNSHSGSDFWTPDEAVYFFQRTLDIDREMGFEGMVCHETHRNRAFYTPFMTDYVLQRVPQLKITADFSHWVVVGERLMDEGEEDRELLDRVIPHVYHIHTRIGTTQSSQCPAPTDPAFTAERESFERIWLQIIKYRAGKDPNCTITWVPEYGPFPYHPFGSAQTYSNLADSEGLRLDKLFKNTLGI
ncbi:xylose isomerase-like protein [Nemania sp. FL0031]|nr:xylose isomerase-like protein [Nemania sp. FL0031]